MNATLGQIQTLLNQLGYPSSGTTNVPQISWTPTGLQIPPESVVLAGVLLDLNTAFGGNINPAFNTPQGQLATSIAAAISNCYALIALMVNGTDPDLNYGFMQDQIARIYYLDRSPGTPTVVSCVVTGVVNTPIPSNVPIGQDTAGNQYICQTSGATIPIGGNTTLTFANTQNGPIPCGANSISLIQAIADIDSVTNPASGVPGNNVESSEALEYQREQTVASNSQGALDSVLGAVSKVLGVTDCYVYENPTSAPIIVGSTNISVAANSIWVAVIGGASASVAQAIWTKKSPGCNYNGNTSVVVTDPAYTSSPPTYTVQYNNNAINPVTYDLTVNIKNSSLLPSSIVTDVQNACAAAFTGSLAGSSRVKIATLFTTISLQPFVASVEGPSVPVQVISIFVGSAFSGTGTLSSGSNHLTIASAVSGSLTPGTPVTDSSSAIPAGTYIVEQISGTTGGVGVYQLSANATSTVSSPETITGTASGLSAQIGIDQAPVLGVVVVNLI